MRELLQVSGLSKSFGGVRALDRVRFTLRAGEVHALMGENGAGKSTFMKILMGLLTPDAGEVLLEGQPLRGQNVHEVLRRGIAMIHQEILAVPELTVAQNMFLGREKDVAAGRWGWVNDRKINQLAAQLLDQLGLDLAPTTPMKYLSVAQMQMVEIAKALSNHAKVLIMDEPTSALSDREVGTLFRIIQDLKRQGVAIIYISHKMDEIFAIADTITVLRDGTYIGTRPAAELDQSTLIAMMVGREINDLFPASTAHRGEEVLAVRNLTRAGYFTDVSFEVHRGEVLGLAGLMGAGRTELARAIFGLDRADSGEIYLKGQRVLISSPREAIRRGIGYVSEDRKALGFVPGLSVQQNLTLASLRSHQKGGLIREQSERTAAAAMITNLRIKASGPDQPVTYLSGGNQQKVVLGKVLLTSPELIMLDEPTRGVDIGAKFEIYKLINQLAASGLAVILISSELPEILGLSDRVLVLSKGRPTALLSKAEATQETIMQYAMQH
ncbi:ribose ABC transporter ATP-binding protein RbsA [Rhabdobacter roseus]|uniref:Inositol transport system ATP-binding protein n=1 Tax=Rhabdobacter roseus TaxID=1655419 RepID=A0A840TVZ5_9BACT|nr:sugar ABC transporter ATP-binding protein [Rhabdobacter roseus]MBB5287414.1 inositol transport system ATP-binding protein [Rhabdobacter roseus]